MIIPMATRERPGDRGSDEARRIYEQTAREIRTARLTGGWSQAVIARAAGMSRQQLQRLERAELAKPTLDQLCRGSSAVGLTTSVSRFPSGTRVRDAAQLRLLDEFERLLGGLLRMRREVPLPIEGDLRAWDGIIDDGRRVGFTEGETRLGDMQALGRRLALKLRDDPRGSVLILVVRRTVHNRGVLAEHREALRAQLPLDGAAIARSLRAGHLPAASGIILL